MNLKTILIFLFGLCVGSLGTYYIVGNDAYFGFVTQSADTDVDVDTDDEEDVTTAKVTQTSISPLVIQGPTFISCPGAKDMLTYDAEVKTRINTAGVRIKHKNKDRDRFDFAGVFRSSPIERQVKTITAKYLPNKENPNKDKYLCIYNGAKLQLNMDKGLFCSPVNEAKKVGFTCAYKQVDKPIADPQN